MSDRERAGHSCHGSSHRDWMHGCSARPAMAQLGGIAVAAAAAGVVSLITNTIGGLLGGANGLLGSINGFMQSLASLWQNVVYPVESGQPGAGDGQPAH